MTLQLMGKSPVRFAYKDGAMEATWTLAPEDPELASKLQQMLDFVKAQTTYPVQEVRPNRAIDQVYKPKSLEPAAIPNGWELLDQASTDPE
jgi:hypothetical protein